MIKVGIKILHRISRALNFKKIYSFHGLFSKKLNSTFCEWKNGMHLTCLIMKNEI